MRYIFLISFLIFSTTSWSQSSANTGRCTSPKFEKKIDSYLSNSVSTITVTEAARFKDQYLFLDAREAEEFVVSHIPDATNIGYDNFDLENIDTIDKDTPIVIYCSIGYRSEKIGEKLLKAGYSNVFNLYGSIFEWANQGLDIEDQNGEKTSQIHTYNKKWSKWVINDKFTKVW